MNAHTKPETIIEKDIPVPVSKGRVPRLPLAEMEIGDSFLVTKNTQVNISSRVTGWARYHGSTKKFCTRKVEGGTRVWRIA